MVEPEFVGTGRRLLVDGLLAAFDQVNKSCQALWIAMEAPSGWGKTRIAREFYRRLAIERQDQDKPAYWPDSILANQDQNIGDVSARRKRVFPKVQHVPGSLPSFFWWGIAASMRDGTPSIALMQDIQQLKDHQPYLDDVWAKFSWSERHENWLKSPFEELKRRWSNIEGKTITNLVGIGAWKVIEASFGTVIPVTGLAGSLGSAVSTVYRYKKERDQSKERLKSAALINDEKFDIVDETVILLTKLARPGLPVVIFVEDAHLADPLLGELLSRLVVSNSSTLIITTAWPGHAQNNKALVEAMAQARELNRLISISHDLRTVSELFPESASFSPLDGTDLADIIRFYYPKVDDETARLLSTRYENPLALELFCLLSKYRNRFPDGDLRLSAKEVANAPGTVRDLYRDLWRDLPELVRQTLTLASLGIPALIAPKGSDDLTWDHQLMLGAIKELSLLQSGELEKTLMEDTRTFAWTRVVSEVLHQFHEIDQMRVANEDDEYLLDDEREDFLRQLATRLSTDVHKERDISDAEKIHAVRLAVALRQRGFVDTETLEEAAVQAIAVLEGNPREAKTIIELSNAVLEYLPDTEKALYIRSSKATAEGECGNVKEALRLFRELVQDAIRILGTDHPDTLATRNNIAHCTGESGNVDDALRLSRELLQDQVRILGTDHPDTLTTRGSIARWTGNSGNVEEALRLFRELLQDQVRILGADHPDTLTTRGSIARWTGESGNVDDALRLSRELLQDQVRILGADHPNTLTTRNNIASRTGVGGNVEDALLLFRKLARDQARILGTDHPDTLTTRNNIAHWTGVGGNVEDALRLFRELLQDQVRILGTDHPDTLTTRGNIAFLTGEGGDVEDALRLSRELAQDQVRILGADHPDTLATRNNIALWTGNSGNVEEALRLFRELAQDQVRILGADHPDTLTTRNDIASFTGNSGNVEDALRLSRELAQDQVRILGADHPNTLTTQNNIAHWTGVGGNVEDALRLFRELLQDQVRILGADHPNTLTTRNDIALWTGNSGNVEDALRLSRELLRDQVRILGADHPNTLTTRGNIALWTGEGGNVDDSLRLSRELLQDQVRILGANHPDTLTTQGNIAYLTGESGNVEPFA
jgi:tetratricopeptide (TPR) repeat protein